MADNDNRPYVGYRSAGRRPESHNDRVAAANAPLNVLRGWAAGTLGLPGDVESLVRMLPGISEKNVLPTTEYFEERLPLRDMSPTGRAFTGLGTLTGGAGVGTGAKAASRGAQALAPAAGALAMRAAELSGAPVYGMGVIKPKGGNWLAGSVESAVHPMRQTVLNETGLANLGERAGANIAEEVRLEQLPQVAVNKWLETKLGKYIKNEMGTPEDPIRALAEQGRLHVDPEQLNFRQELYGKHPLEGQTFMAQHPTAKAWEGASDLQIGKMRADQLLEQGYADVNPWLAKVPPETPVHMVSDPRDLSSGLGLEHLVDELRNAVNPESGLPANLRWKYQDLDKVTVPQAVQRVHDINEWRAAQKAEANAALANNAAAFTHKDYPDAPYKWVELKLPDIKELPEGYTLQPYESEYSKGFKVFNDKGEMIDAVETSEQALRSFSEGRLGEALKYEGETMGHCVGGYCPDVLEGRSRIFSLRNKKTGEPHVTVEVNPRAEVPHSVTYLADKLGTEKANEIWEAYKRSNRSLQSVLMNEYPQELEQLSIPEILQIKGKANKAPKEEYLPFVQDFVKSGKWAGVTDISNTGLMELRGFKNGGMDPQVYEAVRNELGDYATMDEIVNAAERLSGKKPEGFAEGGLVEPPLPAAEFSPLEMDYIIGNVTSGQHEPAYAEGGSVETAHIPFDEAKISSLVNALREELNA